ncbi:Na+/H+ antiporter subunit E [Peptococcaceae bacterium]|nr:Na+/H+ antiporter subunit E [Peptococcaceae bacterium]
MVEKRSSYKYKDKKQAILVHFIFLTITLFIFWIVLSGRMELKYLAIGFICSLFIGVLTKLLLVVPLKNNKGWLSLWDAPWLRFVKYLFWLLWQLVIANIKVAKIILSPKLKIDPAIVHFKVDLPHPVAQTLLANSITLTPGTITIDIKDGEYTVHCLKFSFASSLIEEESELIKRVKDIFGSSQIEEVDWEKGN